MASEVLKYIQSLPEYNEKIFKKITGDIDDKNKKTEIF